MSGTLSVAHVVLSLDVGGLERNVVNQVREAPRLGQRVAIICVERPGTLAPRAEALGATVVSLDKRPGLKLATIGRLKAVLRDFDPDVIHSHQIGPLFYAGLAVRCSRGRLLVHTEHGHENYAGRFRTRWLGRVGVRYTTRFYCLTQAMADEVIAQRIAPRQKVALIHNGIDISCFQAVRDTAAVRRDLNVPAEAQLIGTVGRLTEVKRHDLLLRAFAALPAPGSAAHLLLVGDGPLRADLQALADRLGIGPRVHFAGYQADTAPFLQAMDVFALTSRSEGMPQALLEAGVAGVPVVAAAVGGVPELIEDGRTGVLFPAGDERALVSALARLLADRDYGRRLGMAARERVEARYSIGRMADEYHRDFLELLARQPARPCPAGR